MSLGGALTRNAAWTLLVLAFTVAGCSAWRCPVVLPVELPVLKIAHWSGGVGPIVYVLEVHESGTLNLEKVGLRSRCAAVSSRELAQLRSILDAIDVGEIKWDPRAGMDWEMAQIFVGQKEVRIVVSDPPQNLVPLLKFVDALFQDHFGRRYDMPLLDQ